MLNDWWSNNSRIQKCTVYASRAGSVNVDVPVTYDACQLEGLDYASWCASFNQVVAEENWKNVIDEHVFMNESSRPALVRLRTEFVEVNTDRSFAFCDKFEPPKCMPCRKVVNVGFVPKVSIVSVTDWRMVAARPIENRKIVAIGEYLNE